MSEEGPEGERSTGRGSQTVAAIERAADVLLYFSLSPAPDLGITDIAQGMGVSKAAVHRVLASLRSRDLIRIDPHTRRYSLGPAAITLGLSALSKVDVRRLAAPELVALSAATDETATLSIRTGSHRVYIDQITPPREVIMSVSIGIAYPLHLGASSKAFLAFLPPQECEAYLEDTLGDTDVSALVSQLEEIREQGWAASVGERQSGAASLAAPIFGHLGSPLAVVSVCGPDEPFLGVRAACLEALLAATGRISTAAGWRPVAQA